MENCDEAAKKSQWPTENKPEHQRAVKNNGLKIITIMKTIEKNKNQSEKSTVIIHKIYSSINSRHAYR